MNEDESKVNLTEADSESEAAPIPIARALIFVYFGTLFLVIITQLLSMYNRDKLTFSIEEYTSEQETVRNLASSLFEIENANAEIHSWLLIDSSNTNFNSSNFALHISAAKDALEQTKNIAARYQPLQETIKTALEDLEKRYLLINQALNDNKVQKAKEISNDRRSISLAMNNLSSILRESKYDIINLEKKIQGEMKTLDLSLTIIMTSMIIASIFLAFLWSKVVALH